MIGEIPQNFIEASASVGLILATALTWKINILQVQVSIETYHLILQFKFKDCYKIMWYYRFSTGNNDFNYIYHK